MVSLVGCKSIFKSVVRYRDWEKKEEHKVYVVKGKMRPNRDDIGSYVHNYNVSSCFPCS